MKHDLTARINRAKSITSEHEILGILKTEKGLVGLAIVTALLENPRLAKVDAFSQMIQDMILDGQYAASKWDNGHAVEAMAKFTRSETTQRRIIAKAPWTARQALAGSAHLIEKLQIDLAQDKSVKVVEALKARKDLTDKAKIKLGIHVAEHKPQHKIIAGLPSLRTDKLPAGVQVPVVN